ncbi:MAG TPA: hypothetical protein VIF57_06380 [Polyangia bacterium]
MTARARAGFVALASASAVAVAAVCVAGEAPKAASPRSPVIYVGGSSGPGQAMARIDVHAPGTRGHALEVMHAHGPTNVRYGYCAPPSYSFGEDADLIELQPGTYRLTAKAERLSPPSAFPAVGDATVEGGRCYAPVMTCDGAATDGDACHLSLTPKACAPLRSPRRINLPSVLPC